MCFSEESVSKLQLRHYTTRLRWSRRLRYRLARLVVVVLPLALLLYALLYGHPDGF